MTTKFDPFSYRLRHDKSSEKIYRLHYGGYPFKFLTKGTFQVPYDVDTAVQIYKRACKKYLLVLLNDKDDLTSCYRKHCTSFTQDMCICVPEFVALAKLDGMCSHGFALNYIMDETTSLKAIDDNTFEERVFKKTDIVVL
jgi:hypothetical protein